MPLAKSDPNRLSQPEPDCFLLHAVRQQTITAIWNRAVQQIYICNMLQKVLDQSGFINRVKSISANPSKVFNAYAKICFFCHIVPPLSILLCFIFNQSLCISIAHIIEEIAVYFDKSLVASNNPDTSGILRYTRNGSLQGEVSTNNIYDIEPDQSNGQALKSYYSISKAPHGRMR